MDVISYVIILTALSVAIVVGLVVLIGNRHSSLHKWTGVLIMVCALWGIASTLPSVMFNELTNTLIIRIAFILAVCMSFTLTHFTEVISRTRNKFAWVYRISTAFAIIISISPLVVVGSRVDGAIVSAERGIIYPLFLAIVLFQAVSGMGHLVNYYRTLEISRTKSQISLILWGLVLGVVAAFLSNAVLPNINPNLQTSYFAWVTVLIWTFTLAYVVVRHNFLDNRTLFVSFVAYIIATLILATLFFAVSMIMNSSNSPVGYKSYWYGILLAVLASLHWPLRVRIVRAMGVIFIDGNYELGAVYEKLAKSLSGVSGIKDVISSGVSILNYTLKPGIVTICILNTNGEIVGFSSQQSKKLLTLDDYTEVISSMTDEQLISVEVDKYEVDKSKYQSILTDNDYVFVRVLGNLNKPLGIMCLSARDNKNAYTRKDYTLIETVSNELSTAIERAVAVEQIAMFNDDLRDKIQRSTADLRASNKKLKALDKSKDEFISLTSHQLRTPLTTIKGYLSMMLDGDAGEINPQQRKLLEEAFNSSQRMVHLISDFLNISRIQTGRFELELADVNLADVLDEEIELLRISASPRRIILDYQKPEQFPVLLLDEAKLRQVMMNFIDNAIHYSQSGSVINIRLVSRGSEIEFTVKDNGIGVPKAEQHKLFVKFARASNAREQRPDGTGIGLFMAKKVVVALKGSIIFESVEGKGSTFGFRIPVKR